MALSELSAGHIGRNRRAMETPPDSDTSDTGKRAPYFKVQGDGTRAAPLPTPSSVQSMLKSGTEVGDVGELASKPNRRASHAHRMPFSLSSSSVPPSARNKPNQIHGGKYPQPDEHGLFPGIGRFHGPSRSNGSSNAAFIYRNRSPLSSGAQSRAPSTGSESENRRLYALMHSSSTSRSIPRHINHVNGHLRSQGDSRGMSPRSPLAYPTRLKRPGYRPSSPALTEVYRSGSRSPFGLAQDTSFRAASPLSTYGAGQSPSRCPRVASRLDSLLASHQISENARDYNDQYLGDISHHWLERSRSYAPGPTAVRTEVFDRPASPARQHFAIPFPPPLFYDYSEQFQHKGENQSPLAKNVDKGHLRADEEHIPGHNKSSKAAMTHDLASTNLKVLRSQTIDSTDPGQADVIPGPVDLAGIDHGDTNLLPKGSLDIQVDGNMAGSSAIGEGLVLEESSVGLENPEITPQTSPAQAEVKLGQHKFSSSVGPTKGNHFSDQHDFANGRPQTQLGQIHSPIPKRSLSSPSNRERFSSILSIDEDLDELKEVATVSKGVARLGPSEASDYTMHSNRTSIKTGGSSRTPSDAARGAHDLMALPSQTSVPRIMKELPPLPRSSVISVAPPQGHNTSSLPFSFTALHAEETREDESVTELGCIAASYLDHLDRLGTETPTKPAKYKSKAGSDKGSPPPRPLSRPWNSETNYPWNDQTPQFELAAPMLATDSKGPLPAKAPRFKVKLQRSGSTTGTVKIRKPRPSDEVNLRKQSSTRQRFSTSSDLFQSTPFGRKTRPNASVAGPPEQSNTSRASRTPINTRFVESFDLPAHDFNSQVPPSITLVPPSPGLKLEARSFFSDDSSQMRLKGSLRKRLSQLKATVTRASTSDDARGIDRALLGSALGKSRGNGSSSRHSERSQQGIARAHRDNATKWRFVEKVKAWYFRYVARKLHGDQTAIVN